jgi:hypothetical protein
VGLATGTGVALVGNGTGVALMGDGTGVALIGDGAAVAGARDGTGLGEEQGRPDLPGGLGTGVGTAGTGQATEVGSADADGIGLALVGDGIGVAGDVAVGTGVAAALAAGTVVAVPRVAGALADCDATPEAAAPPAAEAGPEHPVSASPAATPNTAPIATRDSAFPGRLRALGTPVFSLATRSEDRGAPFGSRGLSFDRICMLLGVVPTIRTPANTSRPAKSCVRRAATFQPVQPYKHKRGMPPRESKLDAGPASRGS